MELRNRLANESAATAQAARQSTDQILAILHGSSYAGLESAAQRLSPTRQMHSDGKKRRSSVPLLSVAGELRS